MKLNKIFTIGVLALLNLTSCELKNDLMGSLVDKGDMGALELGVSVKQPVSQRSTKAEVTTNNFPITIQGTSSEVIDVVMEYATLDEVPTSIKVPVGQYTVTSHTPGDLEKKMSVPYYAGSTDITVSKDIASQVNVVCRMANSRIQMNYGEDFKEAFSSWNITIDDGTETALSYTENNLTPEPIYWHFSDNITSITVNIQATTTQGNTVSERRIFNKSDASENYEEESDAFTGGDALEINMGTVESSTGDLEGISITANITFEDEEEAVEIPTTEPDEPTVPDEPGEGGEETENTPTLDLPVDFSYSASTGAGKPANADAYIQTPNGLKNAIVKIETTNEEFKATLQDVNMGGNLLNGVELVNNTAIDDLFASVGLEDKSPKPNDTEYKFPIGAFFMFLDMFTGIHTFYITVTDNENITVSDALTITITE